MTEGALPHGYTNRTTRVEGLVTKRYVGEGAGDRRAIELACLRHVRGTIPVPAIVAADRPDEVTLAFVTGRHGQELIEEGAGGLELHLLGRLLATLGTVDPNLPDLPGTGPRLVHGDFGPQNVLIDVEHRQVAALLDWEFAHRGEQLEDLAWAEWIVRMHHPAWQPEIEHLFEGFGHRPAWAARHEAMLRRCEDLARFADRQGWSAASEMWRDRTARTELWAE